jgi:diguanylate cyclase (GGDEF)-like protein/PAS domain S-box-containing protein
MLQCLERLFCDGLLMLPGPWPVWEPELNWFHVSSNLLVALFCYSISILLFYYVRQHRDLPYAGLSMIFGVFTIASGTAHLIDVWTLWHPNNWLTSKIDTITDGITLFTALLILGGALFLKKARRLHPSQSRQLETELEYSVNEQKVTSQQNNEHLKSSEIDGIQGRLEELRLLQSLTQFISEAPDFYSSLCVALRQVCELTHWDYGEAWLPRNDNTVLECAPIWYGNATTLELFRQAREKLAFSPDTGLPGRVWSSQQPEWIEDVSAQPEDSFHLKAQVAGFKAGFGIPILTGVSAASLEKNRVLAVLTFFSNQSRPEDKRLIELVAAVAMQLGLVFQHKQLEEELRQERDFSKTLIETSSAFFVAINPSGKTVMMNQGFLNAVGYSLDEVLGTDYSVTFVREADRKPLAKIFKQLVRSQQPIQHENYVLTKDGRELLVEWHGKPIFKKSGELDFFFAVGIDITERKRLEEELRANQERYWAVIEEQTELICRFVSDGTLTFVNDAYCRYFGKTREELLGRSLFEMIPDEYQEKTRRHIATLSLKNSIATREYRIVKPNGDIQWLQWIDQIVRQEGRLLEFQSIGRDITERRLSEQESARLASIALLSPTPIIETNLAGQVHYLNPEAMRLLPDLQDTGPEHPFLAGMSLLATVLQREGSLRREVKIGEVYYEQVLHYLPEIECLRIYAFDITERKHAEEQLIHNAFYDQLTGLANRALFMDRLRQAVRRAKQNHRLNSLNQPYLFAVLFLDLNRFKLVNNSLGSQIGDQLLQSLADRLQRCLRSSDTLARLGGDEFAILLEGIQDVSDATRVADSIHQTLASPFYLDKAEVFMTLSIGITLNTISDDSDRVAVATLGAVNSENISDRGMSTLSHSVTQKDYVLQPEDLLRNAGIAMYRAKAQGKACYEVFDAAMHELAVDRLQLETDLRRAIERQEFRVYYQPIVSLCTGKIVGFEALVRWSHPQRGLVSPAEFIPTAEETGLIAPIGWWILREACRQLSVWQEQFPAAEPLTMNVNLSGKQFTQSDLLEQIDKILQETQLVVGSLKLEITESVVMENPDLVKDLLLELKQRNIHLCIDDFGTGYSSLSRLHHFPISTLKIDRSFVSRIGALGENSEIIQAIVTLAQTLKMDVVAEGIEVSEQISPLIALQCEYGQGNFFSKPVDSQTARALLMAESLPRAMDKL